MSVVVMSSESALTNPPLLLPLVVPAVSVTAGGGAVVVAVVDAEALGAPSTVGGVARVLNASGGGGGPGRNTSGAVSYTHLTLPTNREV